MTYRRLGAYPEREIHHVVREGGDTFVALSCGHRLRCHPLRLDGTEIVPKTVTIPCHACDYAASMAEANEALTK